MAEKPTLSNIINAKIYDLLDLELIKEYKRKLDINGVLALPNFLENKALKELIIEAELAASEAFFTNSTHNVYLTPVDTRLPPDHVFNKQLVSSKGCICMDQIPSNSKLKKLYNYSGFKNFVAKIVGEKKLYPYEDPLSSINVHYAGEGQELNWHFDNSEFAITLLLQSPL